LCIYSQSKKEEPSPEEAQAAQLVQKEKKNFDRGMFEIKETLGEFADVFSFLAISAYAALTNTIDNHHQTIHHYHNFLPAFPFPSIELELNQKLPPHQELAHSVAYA